MKNKEEESRKKDRNQEDKVSDSTAELGEFGLEYEFFMPEATKAKEKASNGAGPREAVRREENREDQSKTFFLPDVFSYDD